MSIQISKIQLRRGPQSDLPGVLMTPGLDIGEVAFTTDTNRVFIGTDPSTSQLVSLLHAAQQPIGGGFPFSNVEILTEFSPTNQVLFDAFARNIQTAFIVSTPMVITGSNSWAILNIQRVNNLTGTPTQVPFVIDAQSNQGLFGTAHISYHLIDFNTGAPIRTGRLTVFCQGNALPPSIVDDATTNPFSGFLTGGLSVDPNMRYGAIAFKALSIPNGIAIQYQINISGSNLPLPIMYFRVEQPVLGFTEPVFPASNTVTTTVFDINGGGGGGNAVEVILSGDVSGFGFSTNVTTSLVNTGVTAGTYGSNIATSTIVVDEKGRITYASTTDIDVVGILGYTPLSNDSLVGVLTNTTTITLSGAVTGSGTVSNIETNLIATGINSGTYGSSTSIPIISFNAAGQAIAASNVAVDVVSSLGYTPAPLNSPSLSGSPSAPTPTLGDVSSNVATTAFVSNSIAESVPSSIHNIPIFFPYVGQPLAGQVTHLAFPSGITITIPANATGSTGYWANFPSANVVFTLYQIVSNVSSTIGNVVVDTTGNTKFNIASAWSNNGNSVVIKMTAPSVQDTNLANGCITILGIRS